MAAASSNAGLSYFLDAVTPAQCYRSPVRQAAWLFGICAWAACGAVVGPANAEVVPHRSTGFLPAANGFASVAYDAKGYKLVQLLEHPYRYPTPGVESRDFLYDMYPGIRVGGTGTWLNAVAPSKIEYVPGTGIVHTVRSLSGLTIDEYHFTPMGLAENAVFTALKVTRTNGSGAIDAYALMNYHLGAGAPEPASSGEGMAWAPSRDAFYEWGASGVAMGHASVGTSSHHGASPNNPYARLLAAQDLTDDAGPGNGANDAVCGFQQSLGNLAQNQSAWAGWFSVLALDANAQPAVDRVRTWVASRTIDKLVADEVNAWNQWVTAPPIATSPREADLARTQQVMLRMGQVSEPGKSDGQMLASIAPGKWNISWVRDMAYATIALARTGHAAEAKRALAFQIGADVGAYQQYVGAPYQISVVRYFGNGKEESDTNQDGPNVEFDGFGLFLWALDAYMQASNDATSLAQWWPAVSTKVADVLLALQDPLYGYIAPDSSIWEVHWNGKQQHFAYTSITAAAGLCAASRLAKRMNDATLEQKYLAAGKKARDGIFAKLRAPDGTIAQSVEQLAKGTGFLDAAAIEAINWGLVRPDGHTAHATVRAIANALVPPSGRGFKRNQVGGWYDEQEWVFVDARVTRGLELTGGGALHDATLQWNVDQGTENFGLLSELHDATTADYAGEAPMVGFGAGAFLIGLADRGAPGTPACGDYAAEPAEIIDAGAEGGTSDAAAPVGDGGDGGGNGTNPGQTGGCACNTTSSDGPVLPTAYGALALGIALARRARGRSSRAKDRRRSS
jgi:hypothetical protein